VIHRVEICLDSSNIFKNFLVVKSSKYKLVLDTGAPFTCSSYKSTFNTKEVADISLAGETSKFSFATWNIDLLTTNGIDVPINLIGLHLGDSKRNPHWDFLLGLNFLSNKKLHLDFGPVGCLKEGWIEFSIPDEGSK
jgi:hypothetical protein